MAYDDWKTTEPEANAYDERCDDCGYAVAHCTCVREDEPDPPRDSRDDKMATHAQTRAGR